jgi:hypothetical protein
MHYGDDDRVAQLVRDIVERPSRTRWDVGPEQVRAAARFHKVRFVPRPGLIALVAGVAALVVAGVVVGRVAPRLDAPPGASSGATGPSHHGASGVSRQVAGPRGVSPQPATSRCDAARLDISFGGVQSSAQSWVFSLVFTNVSGTACWLGGYPGVSFVDAGGAQVGSSAARASGAEFGGVPYAPVTLEPHGTAVASVTEPIAAAVEAGGKACGAVTAQAVRVYAPGSRTPVDVQVNGRSGAWANGAVLTICTTPSTRPVVSWVQPGSSPVQPG